MFGCALMHFGKFIGADFGLDNRMLFCLDNSSVDAVHDIVRTVFCRDQGFEGGPFTLDGVLQAAVYAVQFLFERIDFIQQIAKFSYLTVDILKQSFKFQLVLLQFIFGCIIGKPLTESRRIGLFHCITVFSSSFTFYSAFEMSAEPV